MGWSTVVGLAIVVAPLIAFAIYLEVKKNQSDAARKAAEKNQFDTEVLKHVVEDDRDKALTQAAEATGNLAQALLKNKELTAEVVRLKLVARRAAEGNIDAKTTDDLVSDSHAVFGVPIVSDLPSAGGTDSPAAGGGAAEAPALLPGSKPDPAGSQ